MQALVVPPPHVLQGRELDRAPRSAPSDEFGLVEPIDGLGERVIEGVPDGSRGWLRAELADAVGVDDREVVRPVVGVVDQGP